MNVHHTPLETNVAWTVKMDKDFIGKAGLTKQQAAGVPRQLVCLVCEAADADPWGYNPIFNGDRIVGMTSSGGYGHRTGKSIALGYVTPDLAAPGTRLEVEVLGKKLPAAVAAMPLYDPKNERMKA
jgi:dimethylglycine dehydrogenase